MISNFSPFPFRIGVDICYVPRIAGMLGRTKNPNSTVDELKLNALTRRIFSPLERTLFYRQERHKWAPERLCQHIAGKWAAKEAVIKASSQKLFMPQIFVHHFGHSPDLPNLGVVAYIFDSDQDPMLRLDPVVPTAAASASASSASSTAESDADPNHLDLRDHSRNRNHVQQPQLIRHQFLNAKGPLPRQVQEVVRLMRQGEPIEGATQLQLSITHETSYAMATAIVPVSRYQFADTESETRTWTGTEPRTTGMGGSATAPMTSAAAATTAVSASTLSATTHSIGDSESPSKSSSFGQLTTSNGPDAKKAAESFKKATTLAQKTSNLFERYDQGNPRAAEEYLDGIKQTESQSSPNSQDKCPKLDDRVRVFIANDQAKIDKHVVHDEKKLNQTRVEDWEKDAGDIFRDSGHAPFDKEVERPMLIRRVIYHHYGKR